MVIIMEENINILDELNKGACMGMDSINMIKDKIKDKEFKNTVENIYKKYEEISRKITKLYYKYDKVAELLLNGTNMGIIEGRKIFNNKCSDIEVEDLIKEFIRMQEGSVEELKQYL